MNTVEAAEVAGVASVAAGDTASSENEAFETVAESLQAYFSFFKTYVQRPAKSINNEASNFVNAVVSMVIFAFLAGVTTFTLMNALSYSGVSFFSVFGSAFIVALVMMVLVITVMFLINKIFGTDYSFKAILSIYGVHVTPVLILIFISYILALSKSYIYAPLLLTGSFSLIMGLIPCYLISSLLTRKSKHVDALYGFIIYVIAIFIVISIVFSIFVDS